MQPRSIHPVMSIKALLLAIFALVLVAQVAARSSTLTEVEPAEDANKMTYGRRSWLRSREQVRDRNRPQKQLTAEDLAIVDATSVISMFDAPVIPTGMVSLHGGNVFTAKTKQYGMKSRAGLTHRELRKRSPPRRHIYANRHKYIHA